MIANTISSTTTFPQTHNSNSYNLFWQYSDGYEESNEDEETFCAKKILEVSFCLKLIALPVH